MERSTGIAAAVFVSAGGLVHLQLWRSGYRGIPYVGPLFVADVAASAVLALLVALLVVVGRRRGAARLVRAVAVAGIAFSLSSLAALVMSRTVGVLGFTEPEWTNQAIRATTAEIGAVVAFAVLLVASRQPRLAALPVPLPASVRAWRPARRA